MITKYEVAVRVCVTGPISLAPLAHHFATTLPNTYSFPLVGALAEGYINDGHHVVVVCLGDVPKPTTFHASDNTCSVFVVPDTRKAWQKSVTLYARERRLIGSAIAAANADVVHAHWSYEFGIAAAASHRKVIVTIHDSPLDGWLVYKDKVRLARLILAVRLFRKSAAFTAVAPWVINRCKLLGLKQDVQLIPNGVPDLPVEPSELDQPARKYTLISVNNDFSDRKNVKALLQAFRIVNDARDGTSLALIGRGFEVGGPAHAWAQAHGCAQGVDFIGPRSVQDIAMLLASSGIYVHPSLQEACSVSVIEALRSGLPVVAGKRSGGIPWQLGPAGELVDVRSPENIADTVLKILSSEMVAARMKHQSRSRYMELFTERAMIDHYSTVISSLTDLDGENV